MNDLNEMNEMNEMCVLECPQCGEENLHHQTIKIFGRAEDGGTAYTEISADAGDPKQTPWVDDFPKNPSSERDAIAIVFWCEHHEGNLTLSIWQDQGSTYYRWTEEKT
jgi:hypothetical protein|tara:strand:+ start:139 stop:462 length:324 start_codon:yes stop_codon:yes gene_type:complete